MVEVKPEDAVARARRARAFKRRSDAARAGIHLPTLGELLRMQPFYRDNILVDSSQFAERLIARIKPQTAAMELTVETLRAMTVSPTVSDCTDAAMALRFCVVEDKRHAELWEDGARRCEFYASMLGDRASMWKVAGYAIDLAHDNKTPDDEALDYGVCAIGWMLQATGKVTNWPRPWTPNHVRAHDIGQRMIDRFVEERERRRLDPVSDDKKAEEPKADQFGAHLISMSGQLSPEFGQEETNEEVKLVADVVVLSVVGNGDVADGRKIANEFKPILNIALPLVAVPNLSVVRTTLEREFPYATVIIDAILNDLEGLDYIKFRPTIFVGAPGSGKTAFAKRFLSLLNVPHEVYSCGGVADASLAGTARRWSTGEPSLPLSLVRRYHCASPGIILDEIEKTGDSRHNGSLVDALLGLLEPSSATAWHDPYIQSAVNVSHVLWLGTANSMDGIPEPLRDRCRRFVFPSPTTDHLVPLANSILRTLIEERGLNPAWALPLDAVEIQALRSAWPGGSLRALQQLVGIVLKVRDKFDSTH